MKVLKSTLFAGLFALLVTTAFAQPPQGQRQRRTLEERAQLTTDWMKKELDLSANVTKKVHEINLKYAKMRQKKMMEIRESGDRSQMRTAMQEMNEAKNKELKPVLGDKKYELYLKKLEERMQNRRQGNRR